MKRKRHNKAKATDRVVVDAAASSNTSRRSSSLVVLNEHDVEALLDLSEVVRVNARAFRALEVGQAQVPDHSIVVLPAPHTGVTITAVFRAKTTDPRKNTPWE